MHNLEEMDSFLERYNLSRLNQEKVENMNRSTTRTEVETGLKTLNKQTPGPDDFTSEFYPTFREELIYILLKLFQHISEEHFQTHSMRPP